MTRRLICCAVARAVALGLRCKCLKLRELRDMRAHAHVRATPQVRFQATSETQISRNSRNFNGLSRNRSATHALPHTTSRNQTMTQKKKGGLRAEMPAAAELMDEIRSLFGQAWADAALREGLRLQREHARLAGTHGPAHADRWLRLQRPPAAALSLREGGAVVGRLAGRVAP